MKRDLHSASPVPVRSLALATLLAGLALPAAALYKVVGPDGRVTYTDQSPAGSGSRISTLDAAGGTVEVPATNALPRDLRKATERFPVTLYVTKDCAPCDSARQLLIQRGVPFTEKRVTSADDAAALERAIGARSVPALTVGAQVLRGLSQTDWSVYLDAAGYPRESRLPKGWQQPDATPLVESAGTPVATTQASAPAAPVPTAPPPSPAPAAPSGLRF